GREGPAQATSMQERPPRRPGWAGVEDRVGRPADKGPGSGRSGALGSPSPGSGGEGPATLRTIEGTRCCEELRCLCAYVKFSLISLIRESHEESVCSDD